MPEINSSSNQQLAIGGLTFLNPDVKFFDTAIRVAAPK
jgi:hypothetical protein